MDVRITTRNKLSSALLSAFLATAISACDNKTSTAPPPRGPVYSLRVIHSSDTTQAVRGIVDLFKASNQKLTNGTTIQLSSAVFDDAANVQKITSGEMQAQLWLASSSLLTTILQSKGGADRPKLTDCQSIMKSSLGIAYRSEDAFLVNGADGSALQRAAFRRVKGEPPVPVLTLPSPRYTGLGLLSSLALTSTAAKGEIGTLTESVALSPEVVERSGSAIKNYYTSESEALGSIMRRSGGAPVFAVTTQQAVKLFKLYNPAAEVEWLSLDDKAAVADYPLCTIETKASAGDDGQALRLTRSFFTTQAAADLLASIGYDKPTPSDAPNFAKTATLGIKLLDSDTQPLRSSLTTFVVDTSIRMDRSTVETIRREVKAFSDSIPSSDLIAIIPASTNPSITTPPSPKGADLDLAITRLTTSGGNAVRTGLNTAFDLYSDPSLQKYRRAIVVFTSSDEPVSQEALSRLANRAEQFIGRRNVDLYVIALGSNPQEFVRLAQFTESVGGAFKLTTTAELQSVLAPLMRQLQ